MNDQHREAFAEEAYDLLAELETSLLELEERPDDKDLIGRVFRSMHTIKGSGAMFGFDDIAAFTHEVETVFDMVRDNVLPVTGELINLTLQARDHIRWMLDAASTGEAPYRQGSKTIADAFKKLVQDKQGGAPPLPSPDPTALPAGHGVLSTYRIRFRPSPGIFATGSNPLLLLDELKGLGECVITVHTDTIPGLEEIDPEACYAYWDIVLTADKGMDVIRDVFIFVEDISEVTIDLVDHGDACAEEPDYKRIGEILVERGDLSPEDLASTLKEKKLTGDILVESGHISRDKVDAALAEQRHVREMRGKRQTEETSSGIRVAAEKLDSLVNLVGELVTVQARLSQTASLLNHTVLTAVAEEVERLTGELRDNTLNIRMLPIGTTFGRFRRLVRDLSRELGKEIEMTTEGAETELDKTVIERLNDPLVHLIRNSIDHGIETPDERQAAGKPRKGTVHLSAVHSGAHVLIRIRDDGRGLDREAIRAKAVEKGLIQHNAEIPDKGLFAFIFHAGFSTAKTITSVSGRGVGMDVVKKAIDALKGSIEITSEKGTGATVTIKLPLTLAIIEGLLVSVHDRYFILPLAIVEECVELTGTDATGARGGDIAHIRGKPVPYIRLRREFSINGNIPDTEQIVVTGINGNRMGFVVDTVIGEHQTVIKSLGTFYGDVEGISGATILGDGAVALILDSSHLLARVEAQQSVR
ncbi:MAG: Chemotaxis protein CheA [Syntrophorhabdus sp. PtaU1.Bin058]|nr:MAG: Chemotaxis protein CheA [Syntrophorhabdus sp. PtaU1.Bin058]